jgi:4-hydroxybenzoate polyprenyltransferase
MLPFFWGAIAATSFVAAIFFLRFWRDSRDRLFALFSAGFVALTLNYAALAVVRPDDESRHLVYIVRLLAFGLILAGVIDKNTRAR